MITEMEKSKLKTKVKTLEELVKLIGPRPREKKVIMCHGTFDVVHPGHIRHLLYAKSKGDILVASLTCDDHIHKAHFRPFVPEDLRAINLAALEMVDYVIIDRNPTPLDNLTFLQPDFFAKGYEYVENGVHPKTQEELNVLNAYGGEFLFTPGDIVYSSSALIESAPPNISVEKLLALMEAENVTFDDLRGALDSFGGLRVHVVGDTIVDSYTVCSMIGGQTKTPTISVRFEEQTDFCGAGAVVAKHLKVAGADVTFSTVLGDDAYKSFVLDDLKRHVIDCQAIIDKTRPTTNKNAIVAEGYRLLKIDRLDNRSISEKILMQLQEQISSKQTDAVIFSDFRHGIFNSQTIPHLIESIPKGVFRVADSQVATRWGNILEFQGFDLLTPNEREARFALGDQDSVVRPLSYKLYKRANCRTLILKLGNRGILAYRDRPRDDPRMFIAIDSFVDNLVDAVGSGDAMLAYATLVMLSTGNEVITSIVGSFAAAVECEKDGNVPVEPQDVLEKIDAAERCACYQI